MISILIDIGFYLHQVAFAATILAVTLSVLWKLLPRSKIEDYHKRYVLITGCDSGFGKATAIRLDQMGFNVFATCLTEEGMERLKEVCSKRMVPFLLDVAKDSDVKKAYATVKHHIPNGCGLWGLVNNAGIYLPGPIEWQHLNEFKRLADVNLWGLIDVTKTFLPLLRKAKGRVINFSSIGGSMTVLNFAAYCVTKYGVEGFSDALRREMRPWGVLVSIIAPGPFKTPIFNTESIVERYRKVWNCLNADIAADYGEKFCHDNESFLRSFSSDENCNPNPDEVVDAVVDAVSSQTPQTRYQVSSFPLNCIAWLPTWVGDKMLELLVNEPFAEQNNNNDNNNNYIMEQQKM